MKEVSFYPKPWEIKSKETIPLDIFYSNVKSGFWQDIVLKIRAEKDIKKQDSLKKKAPSITLSGLFSLREDDKLLDHSGYIAIDIDEKGFPDKITNPDELKSILCPDKYVAVAFTSIRGRGLCVVFKINPVKHREAFYGISEYLLNSYNIIVDPTSVNPSRARFVSFDPYLYVNDDAEKFLLYPKLKTPKKIDKVIYSPGDFSNILNQITSNQINITQDSYHVWLRLAFALVHKFGESGRQFYHAVSQYSVKYDVSVCDKQYTACLRHHAHTPSLVTISTFYYYCKEAGIEIYSERTKKIAYTAMQNKKAGLNADQILNNLDKFEGITGDDVMPIIDQVVAHGISIENETVISQLELFIRQNYNLKRNIVTRNIEDDEKVLTQKDFNDIYIRAKKVIDSGITYELIERLINSDFTSSYNPFFKFFNKYLPEYPETSPIPETPLIEKFFACIKTSDSEHTLYFGKKWMVGVISAIHGEHSPLMLVLCGSTQNTGKTEFFRRMLPGELKPYYAESKLDAGKDDEILMTQKLIIMDDEMSGKSKRDILKLKTLTSKEMFSLREPYGRNNVDLKRLAVLAGTTNEVEILYDTTGNRRMLPVYVDSIDNSTYNNIDKVQLWLEAYKLYKSGFEWKLNKNDIKYLEKGNEIFEVTVSEQELLIKYFEPDGIYPVTATDIKVYIEKYSNQRLSLDRIGKELKRLGFKQTMSKKGGVVSRIYMVNYTLGFDNNQGVPQDKSGLIAGPITSRVDAIRPESFQGWMPTERDDESTNNSDIEGKGNLPY